jgi:hypothetical protein
MSDYIYAYQGKFLRPSSGKIIGKVAPAHVPPFTLRFQFVDASESFDPTQQTWYYLSEGTWTHVEGSVWDFYYPYTRWWIGGHPTYKLCLFGGANSGSTYKAGPLQNVAFNIIDANVTGVTNAPRLFWDCRAMKSICLFDTSGLKEVGGWFERCRDLSYLPNFNFSGVVHEDSYSMDFAQFFDLTKRAPTASHKGLLAIPDLTLPSSGPLNFDSMFAYTYYVESGALALYNKAVNIASSHVLTFKYCGKNTVSGTAELAQIPTSWGGTMSA